MGMLVIVKDWGAFQHEIKTEWTLAQANPKGKPGSVCFPPDNRR
jgi:hypothetical protein